MERSLGAMTLALLVLTACDATTAPAVETSASDVAGSDIRAVAIENCNAAVPGGARMTQADIAPDGAGQLRYSASGDQFYTCFTNSSGAVVNVQQQQPRRG